MDQGRDSAGPAPECSGDVDVGEVGVEAEHERRSLPVGASKRRQARQPEGRAGCRRRRRRVSPFHSPAAMVRVAGVDDRAAKIGARFVHPIPGPVQPDERILDQILRDLRGARHHRREADHLRSEIAVALRERHRRGDRTAFGELQRFARPELTNPRLLTRDPPAPADTTASCTITVQTSGRVVPLHFSSMRPAIVPGPGASVAA